MKNLGYIISIISIILFLVLSRAFGLKANNSVWACLWMFIIIISALISAYRNIKNNKKIIHRVIFGILLYALGIGLFITLFLLINPSYELPLY